MKEIAASVSMRAGLALALFIAGMSLLPLLASTYVISVLVLVLLSAYVGQAWNIMTGFAGQLSLGHALYMGIGGYVSAALFVHYGLSPWLGMLGGMLLAALVGSGVAALGFRFGVSGVYFALLTIAFAEFTRIVFDHFGWVGGSSGLFLPVVNRSHDSLWQLRGSPLLFYYILLALTLLTLLLSHMLLRLRIGYYWQAIREDQQAAQALGVNVFVYKILAVSLSSAMTAIAGTMAAFYDNNLYPDTAFGISRSIDILTGPIIGGLGTLFGPILGAFVLTVLGETMTNFTAQFGVNGLKQWFFGLALLLMVMFQPAGLWPWLRTKLRLDEASS